MDIDYKKALEGRTIKEVKAITEDGFIFLLDDGTEFVAGADYVIEESNGDFYPIAHIDYWLVKWSGCSSETEIEYDYEANDEH